MHSSLHDDDSDTDISIQGGAFPPLPPVTISLICTGTIPVSRNINPTPDQVGIPTSRSWSAMHTRAGLNHGELGKSLGRGREEEGVDTSSRTSDLVCWVWPPVSGTFDIWRTRL